MPETGSQKTGNAVFASREQAGRMLAERVAALELQDPVVLAIPKGGLPVAWQISRRLGAPLGILVAIKDKQPGPPKRARGAMVEGGTLAFDKSCFAPPGAEDKEFRDFKLHLQHGLTRLMMFYGPGHCLPSLKGRNVVLVDDGVHSGWTIKAGIERVRRDRPAWLVLALPVAPEGLAEELGQLADNVLCLHRPKVSAGVGEWYEDFDSVSELESLRILAACGHHAI